MPRITAPLASHHRHCDHRFADAEEAALAKRWSEAEPQFAGFRSELEHHFRTEEEALFPAFEAATGMTQGPTAVMRMEHEQMRGLLAALAAALVSRDTDEFAGHAEALVIVMQQHNLKEENILYPLCDTRLEDRHDLQEKIGAAFA